MSMRSGQNLRMELRMNNCSPNQLQSTTLQSNSQNNLVFPRPPVPCAPYLQMLATPLFNGLWSGTTGTRVGRYQKKHSPTHTHPDHRTSFINFLHLLRSIESFLFSLRARESFSTTSPWSFLVFLLFLDPLLRTTCISSPSHRILFAAHVHTNTACSAVLPINRSFLYWHMTKRICWHWIQNYNTRKVNMNLYTACRLSYVIYTSSLSQVLTWKFVFSLNATHPPDHSHPCSLNATSFSFLTGQVSLPCNMLLRTQLLYNLPLIINDTSLFVSSGTKCLYLFQPIRILASTAASASQSTLSISPR